MTRNPPDAQRPIPCLSLKADDMPWLVIENTQFGREHGLVMILGEDFGKSPLDCHIGDLRSVDSLIVKATAYTRKELDELREWEP